MATIELTWAPSPNAIGSLRAWTGPNEGPWIELEASAHGVWCVYAAQVNASVLLATGTAGTQEGAQVAAEAAVRGFLMAASSRFASLAKVAP